VELFPEAVRLLKMIAPLRVRPGMPVFTNTVGQPIEPNSLLPHWYACQRALGIRVRGLYCTKDTFVTTALSAGVKIEWLEQQTGVAYATLRRHYGKWTPTEGESELLRFATVDPGLFRGQIVSADPGRADTIFPSSRKGEGRKMRKGGLEPPRVFSPQDPECDPVAHWSRNTASCRWLANGRSGSGGLKRLRSGHDKARRLGAQDAGSNPLPHRSRNTVSRRRVGRRCSGSGGVKRLHSGPDRARRTPTRTHPRQRLPGCP